MKLLPPHTLYFNVPQSKVIGVLEQITDKNGRIVRKNAERFPFTGKIRKEEFNIKVNDPLSMVRLSGTIHYETDKRTRIEISGRYLGRTILPFFLSSMIFISAIGFALFMGLEQGILGYLLILPALAFAINVHFKVLGFQRTRYHAAIHTMMHRVDNHELYLDF
ncbi:MAG: hypothetical protein MI810_16580 [Flavobacteriales bacterium]|nr:hypothetical protein [Flavobacteriales bacterium]